MRIAMIADDLTGRNDCALQWFRRGFDVRLPELSALDGELASAGGRDSGGKAQLIAVDTDSRYLSPAEAYRRVAGLVDRLKRADIDVWYKKIDSTLRGNLDAELAAMSPLKFMKKLS